MYKERHDVYKDRHDVYKDRHDVYKERHDHFKFQQDAYKERHGMFKERHDLYKDRHDVYKERHDVPKERHDLIFNKPRPLDGYKDHVTSMARTERKETDDSRVYDGHFFRRSPTPTMSPPTPYFRMKRPPDLL